MEPANLFTLKVKARLQGCHSLRLMGGFNSPDQEYDFIGQCATCGLGKTYIFCEERPICDICTCGQYLGILIEWLNNESHQQGEASLIYHYTKMVHFELEGLVPQVSGTNGTWEVTESITGRTVENIDLSGGTFEVEINGNMMRIDNLKMKFQSKKDEGADQDQDEGADEDPDEDEDQNDEDEDDEDDDDDL